MSTDVQLLPVALTAVSVAYNERKWLEEKGCGGVWGGEVGGTKRMLGDLCGIAVCEIAL